MSWKRVWAMVLIILLAFGICTRGQAAGIPAQAQPSAELQESLAVAAQAQLPLPCKAALLMSSDTGEVLYEHNADEELAMASITKVMTLLLTFEALEAGKIRMEDTVPVSKHAFSMGGSQIWLEPGEIFTLDEMIKAVCVNSANDAAVAVAEFVGGSEPAFVEQMNAKAAELGMTHTQFKNACGLDEEGHYSSARDVAVMSLALMQHPQVFDYTQIWTDTLRGGQTQLTNTNKLLRRYEGITGLKTGTTGRAGVCISATATRGGTGLIAVILGSPSSKDRFDAATALLDFGFANYERADVPPVDGLPQTLPVRGGCARSVGLVCDMPASLLVKKGEAAALRCELTLEAELQAPVAVGQPVGRVELYSGGVLLQSYPVVTEQAVEKMSFSLALELLRKALFAL